MIRFAASNHLCVDLTYDGTVRRIEPYSLRQTAEEGELCAARSSHGVRRASILSGGSDAGSVRDWPIVCAAVRRRTYPGGTPACCTSSDTPLGLGRKQYLGSQESTQATVRHAVVGTGSGLCVPLLGMWQDLRAQVNGRLPECSQASPWLSVCRTNRHLRSHQVLSRTGAR